MKEDKFSIAELFQFSENRTDDFTKIMNQQYQNAAEGKLQLNSSILKDIVQRLGLEFLLTAPTSGGEVCFAESPEVRDDFKTYFTARDLLHYICAAFVLHKPNTGSTNDFWIPYPDPDSFWELCRKGKGAFKRLRS